MDPFELAAKLKAGRTLQSETGSSEEVASLGSVQVVSGTAEGDSAAGYVMVNLGGSSVTQDGTQAIECATDVSVKAGQEVAVQITNGKPRVTGVIGWGDEISGRIDVAATQAANAETLAQEAKEAVEATSQYFWHDSNGAHVSTEAGNAAGARNSLWNSLGMFFRAAANNLVGITQSAISFYDGLGNAAANIMASFGASGARIGYESEPNVTIDSDSIDLNDGATTVLSMLNASNASGVVWPANFDIAGLQSGGDIVAAKTEPYLWIRPNNALSIGGNQPSKGILRVVGDEVAASGSITAQGRITGNGLTSRDEIYRTTDIDPSTAPSANKYRTIFRANDAGGTNMGYMQAFQNTSNVDGILLNAIRMVNGSAVYNGVTFGIGATGTRSVTVSDASAWLTALGLDSTAWQTLATNVTYRRHRGFVIVKFNNYSYTGSGTEVAIGTLAAGYRPDGLFYSALFNTSVGTTQVPYVSIATDGTVRVNGRASGAKVYGEAVFPV